MVALISGGFVEGGCREILGDVSDKLWENKRNAAVGVKDFCVCVRIGYA